MNRSARLLQVFLSFAVVVGLSDQARADAYTLPPSPYLFSCPFFHEDQAQFDDLMNTTKAQLNAKIEGNQNCAGAMSQVLSYLNSISLSFQDQAVDSALQQQITDEVMGRYLTDLQARKTQLEALGQTSSQDYSQVVATLSSVQDQLVSNQISEAFNSRYAKDIKNNQMRKELFQTMNSLVVALKNTDPRCLAGMGGWDTVFPAVLGVSSLAAGYSGFAGQALVSSALTVSSNIADLLRDKDAKTALADISTFQNAQILECTYYSMKFAACETQRAFRLSRDTQRIKKLIEGKYSAGAQGDWEKLFHFLETLSQFDQLYARVAAMGTPLTIDSSLLTDYFVGLQLSPETLPPAPDLNRATIFEKQNYIVEIKNRGLATGTTDAFGNPKSLDGQIQDLLKAIEQYRSKIQVVEEILRSNQAFYDLRADLEARFPRFILQVRQLKAFLQKYTDLSQSPGADPVLMFGGGSISLPLKIINRLEDFLTVPFDSTTIPKYCALPKPAVPMPQPRPTPSASPTTATPSPGVGQQPDSTPDCLTSTDMQTAYMGLLNDAGFKLFNAMAEGTIAQLTKQSVLTVAGKVTDRQNRALQVIINHFISEDLNAPENREKTPRMPFLEYMRDRALYAKVRENYEDFQGSGKTNRIEQIQATLETFENGFEDEILNAVSSSIKTSSSYIPELDGKTGAHLCSLFATMIQRKASETHYFWPNKAQRVWEQCLAYQTLDLIDLPTDSGNGNQTGPKEVPIRWDDPCFYSEYSRNFEMQKLILDRLRRNH